MFNNAERLLNILNHYLCINQPEMIIMHNFIHSLMWKDIPWLFGMLIRLSHIQRCNATRSDICDTVHNMKHTTKLIFLLLLVFPPPSEATHGGEQHYLYGYC